MKTMLKRLVPFLAVVALALSVPSLAEAQSGKSDAYRNGLVNQFFRGTAFTFPSALRVRLYSTCPTASTAGTELSGNGYTAQTYDPGTGNWTAASSGMSRNSIAITFPQVTTAAWTVNCVALTDTAGTTIYYFGAVTSAPVTVNVGATASFAINALQITEAAVGLPDMSEMLSRALLGDDLLATFSVNGVTVDAWLIRTAVN